MEKINIRIKKSSLVFSYIEKKFDEEKLLNTNVISRDELIFSRDYLEKNQNIVALFLNDLLKEHNINRIIITHYSIAFAIIDIIRRVNAVKDLIFLEEEAMPFELCEKIIDNKSLEYISCFSIPPFILEMFDRNNLKVETRGEVLFVSNFIFTNELNHYSKLYYKTNIKINKEFIKADFDDFEAFCKINRHLKVINIYLVDITLIEKLVNILHNVGIKNIKILLHSNINDPDLINELKKLNKEYKSKYNIALKIVYSKEYLHDNMSKQIILNVLKICAIVIVLLAAGIFGGVSLNSHLQQKRITGINNQIQEKIEESKNEEETEEQKINNKFMALLEVNEHTVGWLRVNGTDIDHPVVQTFDNIYYLNRDFNRERASSGWVFMDFRNNFRDLGRNTIIYGHNTISGVIFGTLQNTLHRSWRIPENLIISFDTLYAEHNWRVFSIYRVNVTTDYIQTEFESDEEFLKFLNMIQRRSPGNFNVELTAEDKILTLSTCVSDNRRLVVHAVLITDED